MDLQVVAFAQMVTLDCKVLFCHVLAEDFRDAESFSFSDLAAELVVLKAFCHLDEHLSSHFGFFRLESDILHETIHGRQILFLARKVEQIAYVNFTFVFVQIIIVFVLCLLNRVELSHFLRILFVSSLDLVIESFSL